MNVNTTSSRMERKKEETKSRIVTVAMSLFKEKGFAATTMEQIAREVDIAKGTLYNYFSVKEAIVDEAIKRSFRDRNADRLARLQELKDTNARMTVIFRELIEGVQANKDFFEQYIVYRMQKMVSFQIEETEKSGLYLIANKIIELGQKNGEIRDDLPSYVLEDLFEFSFIEVVKQFYMEPERFNAPLVVDQCVEVFLNALRPS